MVRAKPSSSSVLYLAVLCLRRRRSECIPDDEPDLDWFNRPRNPNEPDPDWFEQSQTWQAPVIHLDDGRILVLQYTCSRQAISKKPLPKEILAKRPGELRSRQMNVTVKSRNGHRDTAVASRFSSLLTADSALFTSSAPSFPRNFFPPPPVRPPALSSTFTGKTIS
jgi:hypothetical protein